MAEQPETRLCKDIVETLNKVEGCYFEKLHGAPYGHPKLDLLGAVDGKMVYLEVKVPGKKPTERQFATMRKWSKKANVEATWVDNVKDAVDIVTKVKES